MNKPKPAQVTDNAGDNPTEILADPLGTRINDAELNEHDESVFTMEDQSDFDNLLAARNDLRASLSNANILRLPMKYLTDAQAGRLTRKMSKEFAAAMDDILSAYGRCLEFAKICETEAI